nr:uncharacterized protein LOC125992746 [Syngnathus scovelli]
MSFNYNGEWTVVRRGRQRQPATRGRERVARHGHGWMDRALSSSARGGHQFPVPGRWTPQSKPNPPVPPPRPARHPDSVPRTYADVVRRGREKPISANKLPQTRFPGTSWQPASTNFGYLVRQLHKVIKLSHHLYNLEGGQQPRMIARMVSILSSMIKPACPSEDTTWMIDGNARNWGHTTCITLKQHYQDRLKESLTKIGELITTEWGAAFEVAVRWARRNVPRITQGVVDRAAAMIAGHLEMTRQAPYQPTDRVASVPPPELGNLGVGPPPASQPQQESNTRVLHLETASDDGVGELENHPLPQRDPLLQRRILRGKTPRTKANHSRENTTALRPIDWVSPGVPGPSGITQVRPLEDSLPDTHPGHRSPGSEGFSLTLSDARGRNTGSDDDLSENEVETDDVFQKWMERTPTHDTVNRHHGREKKRKWCLRVEKKNVVVGDSNLSRMPDDLDDHLQVDSYPGGRFRNVSNIFKSAEVLDDLRVEQVILAFGICEKQNKPKETAVKALQQAVKATKDKFHGAKVWVPIINYSRLLPEDEKANLKTINDHIVRNMDYIPPLPESQFRVAENDMVHWTPETGRAMLAHWKTFLNSQALGTVKPGGHGTHTLGALNATTH